MRKRPMIGTNVVTFSVFCACVLCTILALWAVRTERSHSQTPSELNFESMIDEWEQIWFKDKPDEMSPYRTHGGVI